jgi:hypothetical protein
MFSRMDPPITMAGRRVYSAAVKKLLARDRNRNPARRKRAGKGKAKVKGDEVDSKALDIKAI